MVFYLEVFRDFLQENLYEGMTYKRRFTIACRAPENRANVSIRFERVLRALRSCLDVFSVHSVNTMALGG